MAPRLSHGLTLPELLITLCLLAIIVSIAMPSLDRHVHSNRQETQRHSLLSHLKTARSEAITGNHRVELCGSSNGQQCDHRWSEGWLMRNPITQTVLRFSPQPGRDQLRWTGAGQANQTIVFQANGTMISSNGRFVLCSAERRVAWQLVINRQGRIRQSTGLESGQSDSDLCG
ncbi:GspH/FimT family pseudopilin [Pseudomonas turukhanskensis]|uniref:Type II secretion system protein H n=1 Tax=Pseudomonas turukhanskensis TaxID=1806536 RepID=A0A9W6K4Y3_9PSED|nr:GspH/FimT family pseudopilin [Pseudomonas turukhanskensis]GLK87589.1 type 4 fimbrial biogenesis protein FimT [Pseudomonas turukhanskensis]